MPTLCGSLPFIDNDAQMQMRDITEIEVETEAELDVEINLTKFDMESWKSQI